MTLIRVCKRCYRPVSFSVVGWECIKLHYEGSIKVPQNKVNWD